MENMLNFKDKSVYIAVKLYAEASKNTGEVTDQDISVLIDNIIDDLPDSHSAELFIALGNLSHKYLTGEGV